MMNLNMRSVMFLGIGLVIAVGTAFLARGLVLGSQPPEYEVASAPTPFPETMVLVASRDMAAGEFVREQDLKWQPWPQDGLAEGYVIEGKRPMDEFIGAVVRSAIIANQPITDKRLVHPGDRGFLAAVLTPGMRAVSVPVNPTTGISGFVRPGDRVDTLLTAKFAAEDGDGKRLTRYFTETLLTGIRVIAIDQKIETEDGKIKPLKTVTVEVSPKQAERIAIGLEMGSISLSLHSLASKQDDNQHPQKVAQLAGMTQLGTRSRPGRSYTMDRDVFHMLGSSGVKDNGPRVFVLRGAEEEQSKGKGAK
jgi:pilus assembly protein CpaB